MTRELKFLFISTCFAPKTWNILFANVPLNVVVKGELFPSSDKSTFGLAPAYLLLKKCEGYFINLL